MSHHISFGGPFIKAFHANQIGSASRATGNPAGTAPYTDKIAVPLRRIYLFIQNQGLSEVDLTLATVGSTVKLYAGQSISFDNYNGGFNLSSFSNITVIEAFA